MNKSRNLYLLLLIIIGMNTAKSQNWVIGGTGNLGFSKVTSNSPISEYNKEKFTFSGNSGIFFEKKIGQKSSLGIEVLWVQIEGKNVWNDKVLTILNGQEREVVGVISEKSTLHSSYIGLPVYYQFELGKFGIKGGVQSMIFLFASSNYEAVGELNGKPYETTSSNKDVKLDRIDIGPKVGFDYRFNEKFEIRIDYYHGLADITYRGSPWQSRNRQFTIGLNYIFRKYE